MRRYILLVLSMGGGWFLLIGLVTVIPRQGLGWEQLAPNETVIFRYSFRLGSRTQETLAIQSRHNQRLFSLPTRDCVSLSMDGRYLVVTRDGSQQVHVYDVLARSQVNTFMVEGRASLCPHLIEDADTVTFFGGNSQTERYRMMTGESFELPPLTPPPPLPREVLPSRDILPYATDPSERYLFYTRCLGERPVVGCDEDWAYVIYDMERDVVVKVLSDADHRRLAYFGRLYFPVLWSPDSRYLLYPAEPHPDPDSDETEIRLYDLETDTTTVIIPPEVGFLALPVWSPDSTRIQFRLDKDILSGALFSDEVRVLVYDLETARWAVASTNYSLDDGPVLWSPDSDALLFGIQDITEESRGLLLHMDAETGEITTLARDVTGLISWLVTPRE